MNYEDFIDPEIVDIIRDLNELFPLVTRFSCAGYGKCAPNNSQYTDHDEKNPSTPYISLDWSDTHPIRNDLELICKEIGWFRDYGEDGGAYYFSRRTNTIAYPEAWQKVREAIAKYK